MRKRPSAVKSPYPYLLALILVTNLLIGSLVVRDYGESRDEHLRYDYAERSLAAYTSGKRMSVDEKGPFYVMLARLGADVLRAAWSNLRPIEAWHFMHFLSFLMGIGFLHQICRRSMGPNAALGAVLLFNTQPLLWGHAWINPKDIPFMAFFLGSVALGMQMAAQGEGLTGVVERAAKPDTGAYPTLISTDWRQASPNKRMLLVGAVALALALLLALLLADTAIQRWIANLVSRLYTEGDHSALGRLFSRLAENTGSIPATLYIQKAQALYRRLLALFAAFLPLWGLACAALLLPRTRSQFWQQALKPFIRAFLASLLQREVLLAGLFLGFASAIRALGPASGLLAAGYVLAKSGRKALPVLLAYFAIAGLVTIAVWPGLWAAPVQGYLSAIGEASDFPWEGKVMFAGVDYPVGELPRSYLPALLAMQFTEPVLALFLLGLALGVSDFLRKKDNRPELALAALWFFAPLAGAVALMPTVYDNFRQFLFIIPPMFIFAGMGLQRLFEILQRLGRRSPQWSRLGPIAALILLAMLLFPGPYWGVILHPYQYVYYNQLVGGVGGAFRRYEMDYWTTSYMEAAEYLNDNAPPDAQVVVWGAGHIVERYARPDLKIHEYPKVDSPQDYAVISTRHDKDLELYPDAPVVFQVGRDGATFTVVKRLSPQE
jgi:hypothetical protein